MEVYDGPAVRALKQIGPEVNPSLERALLVDTRPAVRSGAAAALTGMDGAEQAVPALTVALRDGSGHVRSQVLIALARAGPAAKPAVPAIFQLLGDPDEDESVRRDAYQALKKINPDAAAAWERISRISQ